jgi:hypothetical protein
MKIIACVGFGSALALSAFAFSGVPASAVETPVLLSKPHTSIVKVEEHERCERVRRDCHERHHEEHEYKECVKAERCEP